MSKGLILVVDDEANARTALAELLRDEGYRVETAADGFKALGKMEEASPDLVLTDLKMPGMDGIELLEKVRALHDDTVVVVMTAFGAVDTAVDAMKKGAADYLTKPLNMTELLAGRSTARWSAGGSARRPAACGRASPSATASRTSSATRPPCRRSSRPSPRSPPRGPASSSPARSGTGKELIAAAIHQRSPRAKGPFVKLHCAALAESLLESELFGHERGAFTGAAGRREGRFQQADGGTLFLDEIGEISPSVQVKLLRFLQEHEFERVGGNETVRVDVRVIAATNRDLKAEVAKGRFREDLYYRLNVITLEMPALRERPSDVPLLATFFLRKYAAENGKTLDGFTDEALTRLRGLRLAGQRPRAGERHRARRRPLHRGQDHAAPSCRRTCGPPSSRAASASRARPSTRSSATRSSRRWRRPAASTTQGRRDPRHQRAQDPVQAARVPERPQVERGCRGRRRQAERGLIGRDPHRRNEALRALRRGRRANAALAGAARGASFPRDHRSVLPTAG